MTQPTTTAPGKPGAGSLISLGLALFGLYIIWGSSFIGIKIGLEGFPPFTLGGLRFFTAGGVLFTLALLFGAPLPTRQEWVNCTILGVFLVTIANSAVAIAEQWVASGLVAIAVAAIPLWTALFTGLLMQWPGRGEWLALLLGLVGILLLNLEGDFRANPLGALVMICGPISWGLGTVLAARMRLPRGLMVPAAEMLTGGLIMLVLGQLFGERIAEFPAWRPAAALLYLIFFPSLLGFSAHAYLVTRVRPVVANSFAYMNPIVAVSLGALLAGETFSLHGLGAMVVILGSLVLLARSRQRPVTANAAARTKQAG